MNLPPHVVELLALLQDIECSDECPHGFLCTESSMHEGDHIARGPHNEILHSWPREEN